MSLCTHCCAIPTGRPQPSMNLSHAIAVVLAQLFELRLDAAAGCGPTRTVVDADGACCSWKLPCGVASPCSSGQGRRVCVPAEQNCVLLTRTVSYGPKFKLLRVSDCASPPCVLRLAALLCVLGMRPELQRLLLN